MLFSSRDPLPPTESFRFNIERPSQTFKKAGKIEEEKREDLDLHNVKKDILLSERLQCGFDGDFISLASYSQSDHEGQRKDMPKIANRKKADGKRAAKNSNFRENDSQRNCKKSSLIDIHGCLLRIHMPIRKRHIVFLSKNLKIFLNILVLLLKSMLCARL